MQTLTQNLPKSTLVLRETMKKFKDTYVGPAIVNTQYSQDFKGKTGYSISVRVPVSYDDYEFTGTWNPEPASQNTVQVEVKNWRASDLSIPDQDISLLPIEIYNIHLAGMVDGIVKSIEKSIFGCFKEVYNTVDGISGTPNSLQDLSYIEGKADDLNIPSGQKYAVISNLDKPIMIGSIPEITHADKRADGGLALKNASIGTMLDVEYLSSKYVPKKAPQEADNDITGAAKLDGSVSLGDNSIVLTGFTDNDFVQEGDIIEFTNGARVVASANSLLVDADNSTVSIYPSRFEIADTTFVNKLISVAHNCVMHKSAISFVTVVLPINMENVKADYIPDPDTGIGIRLVENGWDKTTKSQSWSIDCMYGANLTRPELIARFDGVRV
jgi:hypothetical protein